MPELEIEESDDLVEAFGGMEVVGVDEIRPSSYNPRKVFPERLQLVRLSLAKFGFLLPIYIDAEGEIMSGHQRHHVAVEMLGAKMVPVVRTRALSKIKKRGLNLMFNRATNDLSLLESAEPLAEALLTSGIYEECDWPDVDVDDPDQWMPVLAARKVETAKVLDANPIWSDQHGILMAEQVVKLGQTDIMPIVVTPDLRIVNGAGRTAAAGKLGREEILVVEIPSAREKPARSLLNLLSMKYEVSGEIANDLRATAFKAAPSVRYTMSVNAVADLTRDKPVCFDHTRPDHAAAWVKHYGPNTLDMGAGMYWDFRHAVQMGANAAAFEPYYNWNRDDSREAAEQFFFSRICDGREFNSIFLSNVMNTVPFVEDRHKLVRIIAALAGPKTRLYASGRNFTEMSAIGRQRTDRIGARSSQGSVTIDNETGVRIGHLGTKPLLQKFHAEDEFAALFKVGFRHVDHYQRSYVFARCWEPLPVDYELLAEAIRFEFDLPWDDGERFGMADRALEVIGGRLGVDLTKY